ncbi:sensorin-A-like [Pomacea canaliculata]|uniref:sensorin-A-like n=1 Tax=Pomacea canaliculata TaxID=400727 RepID=UPI000D73D147|nr:sensorin-A-like [Pomacea canaliculata]
MKMPGDLVTAAVLLAVLCLVVSLAVEDAASDLSLFTDAQKRAGRRRQRDEPFKAGYLFGKRSQWSEGGSSGLMRTLAGTVMSVEEFTQAIQQDSELATHVARYLDRNGDGYVSVSELL